jgi:hypothetical protein
LGIPPTGKNVAVAAWTIDRLTDGKIAGSRIIMDTLRADDAQNDRWAISVETANHIAAIGISPQAAIVAAGRHTGRHRPTTRNTTPAAARTHCPISHDRQPITFASDAAFIRSPSHGLHPAVNRQHRPAQVHVGTSGTPSSREEPPRWARSEVQRRVIG